MDDHAGVSVSEPAVQGVQFVVSSVHWTSGWWAVGVGRMDANQRRQFDSGAGTDEVVLLDYAKHQRRLLPRLAQVYAQFFSHDELLRKFDGVFSGRTDTPDEREDLETLAAALKPLSTWNALDTIQESREACGGQGFLAENRMVDLHRDLDVYVTFEGDNNVLLQLVGKRLLGDFAKQFKGADAATLARFAVGHTPEVAARHYADLPSLRPLHEATVADAFRDAVVAAMPTILGGPPRTAGAT